MKWLAFILGLALMSVPIFPAAAGILFRGVAGPPPVSTCPLGTSFTFDGCGIANINAQFKNANLVSTYALTANGSPATINHIGPFNKAGIDFPVGVVGTPNIDPRNMTVVGTGFVTGNQLQIFSITNNGIPQNGMVMWDNPTSGSTWYDMPTVSGCSGPISGTYTCTLSKSYPNHTGFTAYMSFWPGCVDILGTATTNDVITCKFFNSANNATATLNLVEFAAINGHNATILQASNNGGSATGHVVVTNSHITIDQYSNGNNVIQSTGGTSSLHITLDVENSDCDGGNAGTPLTGPWNFSAGGACLNWASPGTNGNNNSITVKNLYVHEWSGNPLNFQTGYTDVYEQSIVFFRVSLNCGNGPTNVCHGSNTQYGTTLTGSNGSVKMYNITSVYPYGFQNSAITAPLSILGGVNSAITYNSIDIEGATIIANTSNNPGHSTISLIVDPFRIGAITNLKMQYIYSNGPGMYQCFTAQGDIQIPNNGSATMSKNTGQGTSIWTWSGLSGQIPLPYPGQTFVQGNGSSATSFIASTTDNGNGTSTLNITSGAPATMAAGTQIVALRLKSLLTNPTTIVSGSGSTYIITNKSGSGETHAAQTFNIGQSIMPFGSTDPNTGLPTTSTGGSSTSGYNGTWLVGGEQNNGVSNTNWGNLSTSIGNTATIDTDISNNWEMQTAGSGGAITVDGVRLTNGACPNTQPP